jgi:hypothetical protein
MGVFAEHRFEENQHFVVKSKDVMQITGAPEYKTHTGEQKGAGNCLPA